MWMSVKLLESVLKLASIDSAPTNATASTATKRSSQWEIHIMFFSSCLSVSIFDGSRTRQQGDARRERGDRVWYLLTRQTCASSTWTGRVLKTKFGQFCIGLDWQVEFQKNILDWFGLAGWTWSQFWTQAPDRRAPSTTTSKAEHSSGSSQLQLQLGRNDKFSGRMWWRRRSTRYLLLEGRGLFLSSTTTIHHDTVHHDTVHRDTVHHDTVHHDTNIIPLVPRSVVVEEGVVTADGLAVDWVLSSHSPSPWSTYR